MSANIDILVIGATGFTGRLIARTLAAHREGRKFTFGLGARSLPKLQALVQELNLGPEVALVTVDVSQKDQVDAAVQRARVVINAAGPYMRMGPAVVHSCAVHGVGYLDLTGEPPFMRDSILQNDYIATKTGAVIVHAAGFDSIPSDLSAFLAARTLAQAVAPSPLSIDTSTTSFNVHGAFSGGSLATFFDSLELPVEKRRQSSVDYGLSPAIAGRPYNRQALTYRFPHPELLPRALANTTGCFFVMAPVNRLVVQRSWGLLQLHAKEEAYGPEFKYDEFMLAPLPGRAGAAFVSAAILGFALSMLIAPLQWVAKMFLPKPGEGPSMAAMQKSKFRTVNVTTTAPLADGTRLSAKTVITGRGDPGYLLTAVMIVEEAVALVLDREHLPALARTGGVLTPATAFGPVLERRLRETGLFEITSEVI